MMMLTSVKLVLVYWPWCCWPCVSAGHPGQDHSAVEVWGVSHDAHSGGPCHGHHPLLRTAQRSVAGPLLFFLTSCTVQCRPAEVECSFSASLLGSWVWKSTSLKELELAQDLENLVQAQDFENLGLAQDIENFVLAQDFEKYLIFRNAVEQVGDQMLKRMLSEEASCTLPIGMDFSLF